MSLLARGLVYPQRKKDHCSQDVPSSALDLQAPAILNSDLDVLWWEIYITTP
jgi:hypothetical protein